MSKAGRRISKEIVKLQLERVIELQKSRNVGFKAREAFKKWCSKDKKERGSKDEKES